MIERDAEQSQSIDRFWIDGYRYAQPILQESRIAGWVEALCVDTHAVRRSQLFTINLSSRLPNRRAPL
jgi:hypothetical protein